MRLVIVILAVISMGLFELSAKAQAKYHTIYWKNTRGSVVYEGNYEVSFAGTMPVLKLVESYR